MKAVMNTKHKNINETGSSRLENDTVREFAEAQLRKRRQAAGIMGETRAPGLSKNEFVITVFTRLIKERTYRRKNVSSLGHLIPVDINCLASSDKFLDLSELLSAWRWSWGWGGRG